MAQKVPFASSVCNRWEEFALRCGAACAHLRGGRAIPSFPIFDSRPRSVHRWVVGTGDATSTVRTVMMVSSAAERARVGCVVSEVAGLASRAAFHVRALPLMSVQVWRWPQVSSRLRRIQVDGRLEIPDSEPATHGSDTQSTCGPPYVGVCGQLVCGRRRGWLVVRDQRRWRPSMVAQSGWQFQASQQRASGGSRKRSRDLF